MEPQSLLQLTLMVPMPIATRINPSDFIVASYRRFYKRQAATSRGDALEHWEISNIAIVYHSYFCRSAFRLPVHCSTMTGRLSKEDVNLWGQ